MKPLNPIINQILQERYLRPPPALRIPKVRMEPPRAEFRVMEVEVPREQVPGKVSKAQVLGRVYEYPETPKASILDIIAKTEKQNKALVNKADYEKAFEMLKSEAYEVFSKTGSTDKFTIWNEVTKNNPQIVDYKSSTLEDILMKAIDDVITAPVPFRVSPAQPQTVETPGKLSVDTGKPETTTEVEAEAELDPMAKMALALMPGSAYKLGQRPEVEYKPTTQPKLEKARPGTNLKTGLKQIEPARLREFERSETSSPERKDVDRSEKFTFSGDQDPAEQFLKKIMLGDYAGYFTGQ